MYCNDELSYLPLDLIKDLELNTEKQNDNKLFNLSKSDDENENIEPNNIKNENFYFNSYPNQSFENSIIQNNIYINLFLEQNDNLQKKLYKKSFSLDSPFYYQNLLVNNFNFNYQQNYNSNVNKFNNFLIVNSSENIIKIINSYSGSHFLQEISNYISNDDINLLFQKIQDNFQEIMFNNYGNYFLQKIIQKCNKEQRFFILLKIKNNFINICKDNCGNHCIQRLIEYINSKEEEKLIKNIIKKRLYELCYDNNSCHVIQKLITNIFKQKRNYLIKYILSNFIQLSLNINGSSITKKFIEEVKSPEINLNIIMNIENNYIKLCKDQYGNYIVQYALDCYGYLSCKNIIDKILENFIFLSNDKYSSNVIDKIMIILLNNNISDFIKILNFIFFNRDNLDKLNNNKFGQFVVKNIIKIIPSYLKIVIKSFIVNNNSKNYIVSNYGKILSLLD